MPTVFPPRKIQLQPKIHIEFWLKKHFLIPKELKISTTIKSKKAKPATKYFFRVNIVLKAA